MDSESAATEAIRALNGKDVGGRRMKVEKSTGGSRQERRGKTTQKLFIGNVADGTSDNQLRELFEAHCVVVEADVIDGKNYGFVHIDVGTDPNTSHGRQKIDDVLSNLEGIELNGNKLRIQTSTSDVR